MYGFVITAAGRGLLARASAGEALTLTGVEVGSGTVESLEEARGLTALVERRAAGTSSAPRTAGSQVSLLCEYRNDLNGGLVQGFTLTELGVFARVGEDSPVLFLYACFSDAPQTVLPIAQGLDVHRFPVAWAVADGTPVTLDYPDGAFLTAGELEALKGQPGGLAELDESGKVPEEQLPEMNYDPAGSAEEVQENLTAHTSDKKNPHGVTAEQVGAYTKAETESLAKNAAALIRSYPIASSQTVTAGDVVDVIPDIEIGKVVNLKESGVLTPYVIVHVGNPSPAMYDESCNGIWLLRQNIKENAVWYQGNGNVYSDSDVVNTLQGYLTQYDTSIQSAVNQVKIPYYSGPSTGVKTLGDGYSCKLFLLSQVELGAPPGGYIPDDGVKLSYFDSGTSSDTKRKATLNDVYASWWTRSANTTSTTYAQIGSVSTDGSITRRDSYGNQSGCRPALILPLSTKFNSDGTVSVSDSVEYVVTTSGTPSQAIALQGGSAGDTIPVIFSGVAQLSGVTQGQQITSPGVNGFGALNGWLSVFPYWTPGVKVATGSYTGTGSYGSSSPVEIILPFEADLFYVQRSDSYSPTMAPWIKGDQKINVFAPSSYTTSSPVTQVGNTIRFYNSQGAEYQFNQSNNVYKWAAMKF